MVFISRAGKGKRKVTRKPRMNRPRKAPATKVQTVALIKQVMSKENETKYVRQSVANVGHNSTIQNSDIISLLPRMVQDQGEGNAYERLGTKVTPKQLRVNCAISILDGLDRSTAVTVYWYVLTARQFKSIPAVQANANMARLLRTGAANQYQEFNGQYDTASMPVNNSDFTVLKRGSFNLSKNTGYVQDTTTAGNQPLIGPVVKYLDFTIPCPAKFTYEQDNNSPRVVYYPNNFAPFMVVGYIHQDGSTPDVANTDIRVRVNTGLWYDDS